MRTTLGRWRVATTRNEGLGWTQWVGGAARRARTERDVLLLAGVREDVVRLAAGVEAVLEVHDLDSDGRCPACSSWWRRVPWPCRTARALFAGLGSAEDLVRVTEPAASSAVGGAVG